MKNETKVILRADDVMEAIEMYLNEKMLNHYMIVASLEVGADQEGDLFTVELEEEAPQRAD